MAKCVNCGRKGLFLKLDSQKLCQDCSLKKKRALEIAKLDELNRKLDIVIESYNILMNSFNEKTIISRCNLICKIFDVINNENRKFLENQKKYSNDKLLKIKLDIMSLSYSIDYNCALSIIERRNRIVEQEYSKAPYDENGEILPSNTNSMNSKQLIEYYERKFKAIANDKRLISLYYYDYANYLNLIRNNSEYSVKEIESKFEIGLDIVEKYLSILDEKNSPKKSDILNYYFTFARKNKNFDKMLQICEVGIKYNLANSSGKGYGLIKEELITKII